MNFNSISLAYWRFLHAIFGHADNSHSRTDGDKSYVEVNNDIEKKFHQDNELVEEFSGMSKVSENSKEEKELLWTDLRNPILLILMNFMV